MAMSLYGNNLDVSNSVDVTSPAAVNREIGRIYTQLYPGASTEAIDRAFGDLDLLYRGAYPGYHSCDTPYHDIQHVLDVTLAMARLMDGHERTVPQPERLGGALFRLGIVIALFHDAGYVRRLEDTASRNGAELTLTHVSRGARFLSWYLALIGMGELAEAAGALIHFTGYEVPIAQIAVPSPRHARLGCLLGSADIIAQMSDRCYLEKCRDRLYPEFVAGGIARRRLPDGGEAVVYESGEDLVMKTPRFFAAATRRLDEDLCGSYHYSAHHFGGRDLYLEEIHRNVRFAESFNRAQETAALKRVPTRPLAVVKG
jgi:hypothetical protein